MNRKEEQIMSKLSQFIDENISYSVYRYAPESFHVSFCHKPLPLTNQELHELGYISITKGETALLAELKRIIRKQYKKHCDKTITIGFMDKDSKKDYHYTKQLYSNFYNLQETLYNFKAFKQFILSNNCKLKYSDKAELDGEGNIISHSEQCNVIDINKPIIVHLQWDN
jgi:hypothetical protein